MHFVLDLGYCALLRLARLRASVSHNLRVRRLMAYFDLPPAAPLLGLLSSNVRGAGAVGLAIALNVSIGGGRLIWDDAMRRV
jgi:hypothetical protein